jgi:hypothetical protein
MRRRTRAIIAAVLAVVVAAGLIWSSDQITLQGERTIYTVTCEGGTWTGAKCSGRLAAGPRYGFRSSKLRREVTYWVVDRRRPPARSRIATSSTATTGPAASLRTRSPRSPSR